MMKKFLFVIFILFMTFIFIHKVVADDTDLFIVGVQPDALFIVDLSNSMEWVPAGSTMYISSSKNCVDNTAYYASSGTGHTKACTIDSYETIPKWSTANCAGPYYRSSWTDTSTEPDTYYTTDCSRVAIAKRAIKNILDDNNDGSITKKDDQSLGVRLGYMRFRAGNDESGDYLTGNIRLGRKKTSNCTCNANTPCESSSTSDALGINIGTTSTSYYKTLYDRIECDFPDSGTPLASSLNEAKLYLDYHKSTDAAKECRKKFVILISDGSDTYACGGGGSESQTDQYKRRRETVAMAKALGDADYKIFVIGFGATMPHHLKNTLNWAAYYGKTDNPRVTNSGDTNGYLIPTGSLYPSGVYACKEEDASNTATHNLGDGEHTYATSNDPGEKTLNGYAFLAEDADQLGTALRTVMKYIQEKIYSFPSPTVPSVRVTEGDFAYLSSFIPNSQIPLWRGDLKAYNLNPDGTLPVDAEGYPLLANLKWSAGQNLVSTYKNNVLARKVYVCKGTFPCDPFLLKNELDSPGSCPLTPEDFGFTTQEDLNKLIKYIIGQDSYDKDINLDDTEMRMVPWHDDWSSWLLGDIFHSNSVIVGSPSVYYKDQGYDGPGNFYENYKNRTKVIIVGANDGELHAFNLVTGNEEWSVIPQSLLSRLNLMIPQTTSHAYFIDSTPKVADVWFDNDGNKQKSADEWRTVLVSGMRKGGKHYFALDITNTLNPKCMWEWPKDSATLAKVGQSWSEPAIGRVKVEDGETLVEKWVAFIGGGFDYTNPTGSALFVIDVKTGDIIKDFYDLLGKDCSFPSPPMIVDINGDGYIDKVYIGDLCGQMWVFNVSFDAVQNKSNSLWTGQMLFKPDALGNEKHPIYYQPAVAFDKNRTPWVYFGTGDRENPKDLISQEDRFYAVKDDGGAYPYHETDLTPVTTNPSNFNPVTTKGWYIILSKINNVTHEKVLAKPAIFNQIVYFTTYTYMATSDPCTVAGTSKLYMVEYLSGGGATAVDESSDFKGPTSAQSVEIGKGVPSAPVITVDQKGEASIIIGTTGSQIHSSQTFSPPTVRQILYWREVVP